MNILVTGSKGFVGKNLVIALENLRDNKDRTRPNIKIDRIYQFDKDDSMETLTEYVKKADFIFHLAGVNRPTDNREFLEGNVNLTKDILEAAAATGRVIPVMISSSKQATLKGRYAESQYGISKRQAEDQVFQYGEKTGSKVYVFRFPNVFGKWARPNYNSAVATFCHNIANGSPITVNDRETELELIYIDDLVRDAIDLLEGKATFDGLFAVPQTTHFVKLGYIADKLFEFNDKITEAGAVSLAPLPEGSFDKKLYSTFLSYLPKERICTKLKMNSDDRGSFTEMFKTTDFGQFSVNITKPGVTKGEHFHNTKWEFFAVVSGEGLIRQRKLNSEEVLEFRVSGKQIEAVRMIPGYTHSIKNLSETEDLVTIMWANEKFDPENPDTFFEKV